MGNGSTRRFGIVSDLSGLSQGFLVNDISVSNNYQIAEARNEKGQVIDIATYSLQKQISLDGLYVSSGVAVGSKVKVNDQTFLVTNTSISETNNNFQRMSLNARLCPDQEFVPVDPSQFGDALMFKAVNDIGGVALNYYGSPTSIEIKYKKNYGEWTTYTLGDSIILNKNDIVAFSGANDHLSLNSSNYYYFTVAGDIEASGNIQSLMNFSDSVGSYDFYKLFYNCVDLKTVPQLSAVNLGNNCYQAMFAGCSSLTVAPQLPATSLATSCYSNMFNGCSSLKDTPQLPASTMQINCYNAMFANCISLTGTPYLLEAETLAEDCYESMFKGCISLSTAPGLAASKLKNYCYAYMFEGCTSLQDQPVLIASSLQTACYQGMFKGCTSLTEADIGASNLALNCYKEMFSGCSNLAKIQTNFTSWGTGGSTTTYTTDWVNGVAEEGMFVKLEDLSTIYGVSNIPMDWNVVEIQVDPPEPPDPPPTSSVGSATIVVTNIPDVDWDFSNATTSSLNLNDYVQYDGSSTLVYTVSPSLPAGVTLADGILSANKDLMTEDINATYTITISASDVETPITVQISIRIENVEQPPVPEPTITIATIPAISWDFENAATSSINLASYVTYSNGSSTINYAIVETLPTGIQFSNGILSANKDLMEDDYNQTLTLSAYASDADPATQQFSFEVSNVIQDQPPQPQGDYIPLTFKGLDTTNAIQLSGVEQPNAITLQYKKNTGSWNPYTIEDIIELSSGETVSFRGENSVFSKDVDNYYFFKMTGTIEAGGNIQSLINYSTVAPSCCYLGLFRYCSSLVTPPVLSATTLNKQCYAIMFANCYNLSTAPALPVTSLASSCYQQMFAGCQSLSTAPQLPATNLKYQCYTGMFKNCTSLTAAPDLPSLGAPVACYYEMFMNCTNLSSAPAILPATGVGAASYQAMFYNCVNLSTAPQLPATELVDSCYEWMFYGCTHLTTITAGFTNWTGNAAYRPVYQWVSGVSPIGTFYKLSALPTETGISRIPVGWNIVNIDAEPQPQPQIDPSSPLTFKGNASTNAVQLNSVGSPSVVSLQYSKNGGSWTNYTMGNIIGLASGDTVSFSGANSAFSTGASNNYYKFAMTGNIIGGGNIQSLLNYSTTVPQYGFCNLFSGCSALRTTPQLPATDLNIGSYMYMFRNCTNIKNAPTLPATLVPNSCYGGMFLSCSILSSIDINFTFWNVGSETNWMYGVQTNYGIFKKPSNLPETRGVSNIPCGWVIVNK